MAKTFYNGANLHRLLETAPLAALHAFLSAVDNGRYAAIFDPLPWVSATDAASTLVLRTQLLDSANALKADDATPLERHASRILTLAEGRGVETIHRVATRLFEEADSLAFAAQLDDLGRTLWLYQHQPQRFEEVTHEPSPLPESRAPPAGLAQGLFT